MKGRKLTSNITESGKCVHVLPLEHLNEQWEDDIRWRDGMLLRLKLTSGEKLVGTLKEHSTSKPTEENPRARDGMQRD